MDALGCIYVNLYRSETTNKLDVEAFGDFDEALDAFNTFRVDVYLDCMLRVNCTGTTITAQEIDANEAWIAREYACSDEADTERGLDTLERKFE